MRSPLFAIVMLFAVPVFAADPASSATPKVGVDSGADQAKAREILERAIKSHGGEAVLGKFVAGYCKGQNTEFSDDKKIVHNFKLYIQGDDKMRAVTTDPDDKDSKSIEVVNGIEGWYKKDDNPTSDIDDGLDAERENVYINWATMLTPLLKEGFHLSTIKEKTISGRPADGILITHEKHQPLKFFFDKESHLLVGSERKLTKGESEDEGTEETVWSDFQDIQGTKQSMMASVSWDGVEVLQCKVKEVKFYEKPLDEKIFTKP